MVAFPLIYQIASAGIGTLAIKRLLRRIDAGLPRFHRAGPSTSLDKSYAIQLCRELYQVGLGLSSVISMTQTVVFWSESTR